MSSVLIMKDDRAAVDLFRQKFAKLVRSTVWGAIRENEIQFSVSANVGEPVRLSATGPSEEAVDAFVLTLRFFLQDNESISIRNLAELLHRLPLDSEMRDRVVEMRIAFNSALDRPCGIKIDAEHPSNREVLEIFVYGGLAHANPQKRAVFENWSMQPIIMGMMTHVFFSNLVKVLHLLVFFDHTFHDVLDEYEGITVPGAAEVG